MIKPFAKLSERIKKANTAMDKALEREYPIGIRIRFYIMHGQISPSKGQVIGYSGGEFAYLRVRLDSRTQQVRDVSARNVL